MLLSKVASETEVDDSNTNLKKSLSIKYLFEYKRTLVKLTTLDWLLKKLGHIIYMLDLALDSKLNWDKITLYHFLPNL